MHKTNVARGTDKYNSQHRSMTKDNSISSQADSNILLVGKSEIGNTYSKLDDLSNICGSKNEETNESPISMLQLRGAYLDQGKPNLLDCRARIRKCVSTRRVFRFFYDMWKTHRTRSHIMHQSEIQSN